MTEEDLQHTILDAVLNDDVATFRGLAQTHDDCANLVYTANYAQNPDGENIKQPVLMLAASNGSTKVMQWLIDHGATLEARSNLRERTALFEAAEWGKKEAVILLLASGADPFTSIQGSFRRESAADVARDRGFDEVADIITAAQSALTTPRVLRAQRIQFKKG